MKATKWLPYCLPKMQHAIANGSVTVGQLPYSNPQWKRRFADQWDRPSCPSLLRNPSLHNCRRILNFSCVFFFSSPSEHPKKTSTVVDAGGPETSHTHGYSIERGQKGSSAFHTHSQFGKGPNRKAIHS